jgi:hypothetical protein
MKALQDRLRIGVGLLQFNAPVFEFLERDRCAGNGAAHEGSRANDTEIAIQVFDFRLPCHRRAMVEAIEQAEGLRCGFSGASNHATPASGRAKYSKSQEKHSLWVVTLKLEHMCFTKSNRYNLCKTPFNQEETGFASRVR